MKGTPIARQGTRKCRVSVLVTKADGTYFYKDWVGGSAKGIHKRACEKYEAEFPGCKVEFGTAVYSNNYGAH